MPSAIPYQVPSLSTFLKSLKTNTIESSIELLISLLKRRQIKNSRQCALATAHLLRRVVALERISDAQKIIDRIREVGRRLIAAQPREMAVGNIVRRVLGVVREVVERAQDGEGGTDASSEGTLSPIPGETKRPNLPKSFTGLMPLNQAAVGVPRDGSSTALDGSSDGAARRPGLISSSASYAGQPLATPTTSLLSFLEHPLGRSPAGTPPTAYSPSIKPMQRPLTADGRAEKLDLKAEVIDGIRELLDELDVVDTQIAESALDHIHSNETILTHTSSQTIQRFLTAAAHKKRKFTIIHAEAYPNDHESTHATILNGSKKTTGGDDVEADERWKPLTDTGYVTVILIPDTAVFALMSRINKVLLAPHAVLANGSLVAASGASTIALAAQAHKVPVVVLSGVYKLSPVYPFDTQELIEYGDPGKVVPYEDGEFMDKVDVVNPVYDFVEAESVDLYITNLGGCAPSFLYRIVADHYRAEDIDLAG
jgi:translation initiation factor eIF-2B subunit beta